MNTNLYKKSGIMLMNMARDFLVMQPGDRIPTILEYTEQFSVSRGIVQNALAELEETGCIHMDKKGVKGTFLTEIHFEQLYPYTNWGSITGTMPVPMNPFLSSLTTAVCEEMDKAPFPFSFAYVTGSEKRMEAMKEQMYDFMIVSKSTAQVYLKQYEYMSACMELNHCIYSPDYVIYFFDPSQQEIADGMRVAIDPKCSDQAILTKILCQDKKVEYVEFPYVAFGELIHEKKVDCVVYRLLDWYQEDTLKVNIVPIHQIEGYSYEETRTPVILVNRENYGIDKLLQQYLHIEVMQRVQEEVLKGEKVVKFY